MVLKQYLKNYFCVKHFYDFSINHQRKIYEQ